MMDKFKYRKYKDGIQNHIEILEFIVKCFRNTGKTPSTRNISDELDLSMSAVQRNLRQFDDDGLIVFHGTGSHRTYELIGVKKHETV